jgi:DNA-binding GntR family transcriptional regulator
VPTPTSGTRKKIYNLLKEEIFTCVILPEEILVVDNLAKRFGVSRTPVREALLALCNEGLLKAQHHVGFIVPPVNPREIIETYSLRIMLEKESARLAADRIGPESLSELEECTKKPLRQQGRRFHSIIAAASGWGVLAETIEDLLDKSARTHALFSHAQDRASEDEFRSVHGHGPIRDFICAREAEKAAFAMELHLGEARERVLKAIAMI